MTEALNALALQAIDKLDDRGIDYCVLRNFEFLTGAEVDGDVDILAPATACRAVDSALTGLGFQRGRGDTSQQTTYLKFHVPSRRLLVLDFYWDAPTYNGIPIIDGARTMERARRHEGVRVPSEEDLFVELLFHGALNKNGFRREYEETLRNLADRVSEEQVLTHASAVFGQIGRYAARGALNGNLDRAVRLKWPLVGVAPVRHPSRVQRFVWNLVVRREIVIPLKRGLKTYDPTETVFVIAILGPDGAGKTTVTDNVATVLREAGFQVTRAQLGTYNAQSVPLRFGKTVLQRVGDWRTRLKRLVNISPQTEESDHENDHGQSGPESLPAKRPSWKSGFHIADIAVRLLSARSQTHGVLVADRFVHDVVAYDDFDSHPERTFQLFEGTAFTGVVLGGDARTIADRSEYDRRSIERMLADFEQLDLEQVDATQDIDSVVDDVLEAVFRDGEVLAYSNYVR
ncbi:hypothetical protein ACFQFH_15155 [Halobaculum halobium]|uniref:hypothetical protein n=1 Tax=Halobaculum halobium TaxID=3032281 RepID=UPI003607E434